MRIYSIAIPAYLTTTTVLFATSLPTPFATSRRGLSPYNALGTRSTRDLTLYNVYYEADKVTGSPGDEHDLQARGNPTLDIKIPQVLQDHVSSLPGFSRLPDRIYKPADRSNITQQEQSYANKLLEELHASVAGLPHEDRLRKQFLRFRGRLKRELQYSVDSYAKPNLDYISILPPLRDILPDLPERITTPASRFKITEEEQQSVNNLLLKLKASLKGLSSEDERCKQFTRLKGLLHRNLGYEVDIGNLDWELTTAQNHGAPGTGSGGQTMVTFFEPVGQPSGSPGGGTSTVPAPPPPV